MVKFFGKFTILLTVTAFSTTVIGHTQNVPHSHEGLMLYLSDYWLFGLLGTAGLLMAFVHIIKKSK